MTTPQPITVSIEKLVYGGDGLSRLPDRSVLFTPYTLPGETVMVERSAGSQKQQRMARLVSVETTAAQRVTPRCSVFGQCGGCQWQHMDYPTQLTWKREIVQESLRRLGKLPDITVEPVLSPPESAAWAYRNKAEWHVKTGNIPIVGYTEAQSHHIIAFDQCWIIPEAMSALAQILAGHLQTLPGLTRIQARWNPAGETLLIFSGPSLLEPPLLALLSVLQTHVPKLTGLILATDETSTCLWGQPFLIETVSDTRFQVSAGSFFQVNLAATGLLLDVLSQWLPESMESLLDLYAGVGLFAITFRDRAQHIVAIESSATAVADAHINIAQYAASHIDCQMGDGEAILTQLDTPFQVAIIDPPRQGCSPAVLARLNALVQQQLFYISCDPTTLARDLRLLCDWGWQVDRVQPIDMFAQTYHIETIVQLSRQK